MIESKNLSLTEILRTQEWAAHLRDADLNLVPGYQGSVEKFVLEDIATVICAIEWGEETRYGVFHLKDGRFAFLNSVDWADWTYSGTDSFISYSDTLENLIRYALDEKARRLMGFPVIE